MIDFELTPRQADWQARARDFAAREIRPLAWRIDQGLIKDYPWDLLAKMAAAGLLCLAVPQEYGGGGLDLVTSVLVLEELAKADAGMAFTASLNSFPAVLLAGTEAQRKRFLPLLTDPDRPGLSAFALTEPMAGSDAASLLTTARKDGDDYVLNGEKSFISNADLARVYTIFASVDRSAGLKGITAFLVPEGAAGLGRGKVESKMGFHSSHTGSVVLSGVRAPAENRLGAEGEGFKMAMKTLDVLRVLSCGALGAGLARASLEAARRYLLETIGPRELANSQGLAFELADLAALTESAGLMVLKAAWLLDRGRPATTMSGLTKFLVSDLAVEISSRAFDLVGLAGCSEAYPLGKYLREAKLLQIYEGTNQIARLVAARGVIGA